MKEFLGKVEEFQRTFSQLVNEEPVHVVQEVCELRYALLLEENKEYVEACLEGNTVEIADALGDMLYVLLGTINTHGMQHIITDVFNEIHSSNMSKLDEKGFPIYREDGKILKGPDYFKPNLEKFFKK